MTNMDNKGLLLIVSGPSGVGKGTICRALLEEDQETVYSVSATTRKPRPGEEDGVHYHFLDRETFLQYREKDAFLEWAEVYGNYYGTLKAETERVLASGRNVILEIDTQGAMNVKKSCPEGVSVFILPPSLEELSRRIIGRGTETPESLAIRQAEAEAEIALAKQYDYQIINQNVDTAVKELADIIRRERQNRSGKEQGGSAC